MSEVQRIADQLRRIHDGDSWHGPSVRALLDQVSHSIAFQHPIPSAHSIAELVQHMTYWHRVVLRRLHGEEVNDHEDDWREPVRKAAPGWRDLQADLEQSHHELVAQVVRLSEEQLYSAVPGQTIPIYDMLHGVVQHDAYHAGQIAILMRATGME